MDHASNKELAALREELDAGPPPNLTEEQTAALQALSGSEALQALLLVN